MPSRGTAVTIRLGASTIAPIVRPIGDRAARELGLFRPAVPAATGAPARRGARLVHPVNTQPTGIRLRVRMTLPTFFIQVVPGAPGSVTVVGYAKARVPHRRSPRRTFPGTMGLRALGTWFGGGREQ